MMLMIEQTMIFKMKERDYMKFNDLKELNNEVINKIKKALEEDKLNSSLRTKLIVNTKIGELLENDEGLFFHISIEDANKIIGEIIDDKEQIQSIYLDLTSPEEYKRLKSEFKL